MTPLLLACAILTSALFIGLVPVLVDLLKKSWQIRLNQPADRLEWAVRLFYFTWLPAMPLIGWALDYAHNRGPLFLFCGLLGLILVLAWLGLIRSFAALLANMFLLGIAYSTMTVTAIRLMAPVFRLLLADPDSQEKFNLAAMNLGFIAVGIGALAGPGILSLIDRWWGYRQGLLYVSLACIVPAALAAVSETAHVALPDVSFGSWKALLIQPNLAMIAGIILLYFAMENCLEFWPAPYLKELGYMERGLQIGLVAFWLAFIAMRGVAVWWFYEHPHHGIPVALILVILSAIIMGNLAVGYEVGSGSAGFWISGACYGPLLPCFLGIALDQFDTLPATALGILLSLSGLDTLIVRPLMQTYAAERPARLVMRVPIILALVLAAPLLIMALNR